MIDPMIWFFGCMSLFIFFCTDFYFAFVLNVLKRDHPSIDDSAPNGVEVDSIFGAAADDDDEEEEGGGSGGVGSSERRRSMARGLRGTSGAAVAAAIDRQEVVHRVVVAASFAAPVAAFLQMLLPAAMGWSRFNVPNWLGYFMVVPCLMLVLLYVSRALRISRFQEVSKGQWLSMMWFRLDVICLMATLVLIGLGDWLVALCLYTVDLYLAHRLLVTERRLAETVKTTQLLSSGGGGGGGGGLASREELGTSRGYAATSVV